MPFEQAYAQMAQSQAASDQGDTLDEIVVTAERRAEDGQRVPAAIQRIDGAAIAKAGYTSVTDLQYLAPGVQYDPTNGAAFQVRGVGSQSFDFSNAKSVSIVVDDVVMDAQRANGLIGLVDLASVDVLMGPQGTLFGMNSTSGVIAVTTNRPRLGERSMRTSISHGERNDRIVNGTVNLPLGDRLALRVSGFDIAQDGFGRNVTRHSDVGAVDEWGGRTKLYFEPSDAFNVTLSGDYAHHRDSSVRTPAGGQPAIVTTILNHLGVFPGRESNDTADSQAGFIETREYGGSLHMNATIGGHDLTSITAYRRSGYDNATPIGFVPTDRWAFLPFNFGQLSTRKVSQEVHLASPTGGFVEYLVGGFYNRLSARQTQYQWGTFGAPLVSATGVPVARLFTLTGATGRTGNTQLFESTNESIAAFGQLRFNVTPRLTLAAGGRYTHDDNAQGLTYITTDPVPLLGYTPTFVPTGAPPVRPFGRAKGDNLSVRVSPQYRIGDTVTAYATFATGYKPGGIAFVGNRYNPYRRETVRSWEAGIKSEWFGRRLRLNVDAFRSDFDDFQASVLTTLPGVALPTIAIGNAGGLRTQGVEAMVAAKPARSVSLSASATYTDAKFTDYRYNTTTDYTGTRLSNAPEFAANAAIDYERDVAGDMGVRAHVDYAYRSAVWTAVGEPAFARNPAISLVNARISLLPADGKVEVGIYARNLFDRYFSTGWISSPAIGVLHYTTPAAQRTVGAFLNFNF